MIYNCNDGLRNSKPVEYNINDNGCWICTSHKNKFYPNFTREGKRISIFRYIYELEINKVPEGKILRHKCDNIKCINPKHLEIGTQAENMKDKAERNHNTKGSKHHNSKLTEEQITKILKDKRTLKEIAKEFNIAVSTVSKIKNNKLWQHIKRRKK